MNISMSSDVTHQPSTTSPSHQSAAVTTTTAEDPILNQFQQMRSISSSFLGARQDSTPNSELLSGIEYKAKEGKRQVTTIQQAQVTTI